MILLAVGFKWDDTSLFVEENFNVATSWMAWALNPPAATEPFYQATLYKRCF